MDERTGTMTRTPAGSGTSSRSEASPRSGCSLQTTQDPLAEHGPQTKTGPQTKHGPQTEARMFARLHRRLAWLYTATSGTILTLCLLLLLFFFGRGAQQQLLNRFEAAHLSLLTRLRSDTTLSDRWLAQLEAEEGLLIHIEENGVPLRFQGAWSPPSPRKTLIGLGLQCSLAEGIDLSSAPISSQVNESSLFLVTGPSKDRYYGKSAVLATKNGVRGFCMLRQKPPILRQLGPLLILLCFLEPAALCLLFFISWRFVGRSLRPVQESHQKQSQFIAAASHELRSPLAVIRSSAEALMNLHGPVGQDAATQEDLADPSGVTIQTTSERLPSGNPGHMPPAALRLCRTIDRECVRMSRLIQDMLLLASADAGTWSLELRPVDIDTLLLETYEAFLPLCRQNNIHLLLDLPADPLPQVLADPQRLTQILSVLLDNALTYTPEGKQITVQALPPARRQKALTICLWDEGPGIPDPEKERIFDRFYQADPSRQDKQHFGLGLCIARELAAMQGAQLTVHDGPGGGAMFRLGLLVAQTLASPRFPYRARV